MTQIQDHGWEVWVTHAATTGRSARSAKTLMVGWYRTEEEAQDRARAFKADPTFNPATMALTVERRTTRPLRTDKKINALWL